MAGMIKNFIPEVWAAALVNETEKSIVGKNFITEVPAEDIAFGNSVHINTFGNIELQDYVNGTDLTDTDISLTDNILQINKQKAFNIPVYDTDMRQCRDSVELMNKIVAGATIDNAAQIDKDIFEGIIADAALSIDNYKLSDGASVQELFRQAKVAMDKKFVPKVGRKAAVSSEITSLLLTDTAFAAAYYTLQNTQNPLLADGYIGKYLGFEIFETELVSDGKALFTHPLFNYLAHQIDSVEDVRMAKGFGDYVRGLNVYGVKAAVKNSVVVNFQ